MAFSFEQWTPKVYRRFLQSMKPKRTIAKNALWAFFVGGLFCALGQGIHNFWRWQGLNAFDGAAATAAILVFIGAFLTGIGVYDQLGKHAGAGSLVPITGFANAVVASAMEFKREGYVFGVGAKMFTIAGPVIVYGCLSSVVIGLIYFLRMH
ncbi:stage V sporulation protein AC [Heliophilum fasciatum]|uniref:Stage V sporulation protein AC n=1 Tax=Heliophilum fasciatum TaxID=35700 RepID=A0A4R2RUW2_9FIRM|nr:stage V sporulation protein AC [Heliophilum fasciatum]MCW2277367.1 stage V sporulation protein AC [Heliophilum fasciatum]TCP67203.1 stage V sporulation protein AC [Heliophilum fasciatum]